MKWIMSIIVTWAAVPFILLIGSYFFIEHGMLWIFFHQMYYYPLEAFMGPPMFLSDGDIGFQVTPIGRITAFIVYSLVIFGFYAIKRLISKFLRDIRLGNR